LADAGLFGEYALGEYALRASAWPWFSSTFWAGLWVEAETSTRCPDKVQLVGRAAEA